MKNATINQLACILILSLLWPLSVGVCDDECDVLEISGPERVVSGNLAVFELNGATDWRMIPPNETTGQWAVDTTGRYLYYASPIRGKFTVCAAVCQDGVAKIVCKTFVNAGPDDDDAKPTPEPDEKVFWIRARINSFPETPDKASLSETIIRSFQSASSGIERGVLKTPSAVRALLRQNFSSNIAMVPRDSRSRWSALLDEIGLEMEKNCKSNPSDMSLLKNVIDEIVTELNDK